VSLRDLIGTADYINHAIPDQEEIEGAITRLSTAGLATLRDELFFLTAAGRALWEEPGAKGRSLLKKWERVAERLRTAEFPELEVSPYKLETGRFEKVLREYHEGFSKTLENTQHKKQKPQ